MPSIYIQKSDYWIEGVKIRASTLEEAATIYAKQDVGRQETRAYEAGEYLEVSEEEDGTGARRVLVKLTLNPVYKAVRVL